MSGNDPDEDLMFIKQTLGTQTSEGELDILIDYKNQYNELVVLHEELEVKYRSSKEKFQEAKYIMEEQKFRLDHLPMAYQDGYLQAVARLRRVERENIDLRDKLKTILDTING